MAAPITLAAILKTVQEDGTDDADKALARSSTLLSMIPHIKDFHGNTIDWSVAYAGLGGRSHNALNAEANDQNGRYARFSVGLVSDYNHRKLNGALVRRALKGGVTTEFIDYLKGEMNLATKALSQNLAKEMYGSRTGRRGVIGSMSSADLTLTNPDDAGSFYVGDKIVASATDGGTLRDTGDFVTLIAVNTETGVLTADANWSNIASIANGDSLYVQGDNNAAMFGLGDYVPSTAPTSGDAVFGSGVDRSIAVEQLAGVRLNTTGQNIETVLIKAMANLKKKPGSYFDDAKVILSTDDMANLRISKEGSRFVDSANQYQMEIEGFKVGNVSVYEDVFAPAGTFWVIGESAFELHTCDGVQLDTTDGNETRKAAGDTYTLASVVDGNFVARRPAGLARGTVPTT